MNNIAHECNSKHPSTYDLLKEMRTQGILVIYIGFAKEAIFHILFECAITVYTIELVAILTKFFIKDIAEIPNPLLFVFFPSILVVPVTFLFILLFIKQFLIWVQPYSKSTEENIIKDLLLNQGTLVEILKIIHLFGAGFYIGLTASISAFFCCRYADNISNKTEFIMAVVFIGIVFGIIWNITGYYRDKRYFLAKFIDRIPQSAYGGGQRPLVRSRTAAVRSE